MPNTTRFVFMLQRSGRRHSFQSCTMTGKPRPPRMTPAQSGRHTNGSPTNCIMLSDWSENPRLVNAEIESNTPFHAARPTSQP